MTDEKKKPPCIDTLGQEVTEALMILDDVHIKTVTFEEDRITVTFRGDTVSYRRG